MLQLTEENNRKNGGITEGAGWEFWILKSKNDIAKEI
jgi:hypothetical protein